MPISSLERGIACIRQFAKQLTDHPGVYRMLDEKQIVLYVGKARQLKKRVLSYTNIDNLSVRLQRLVTLTQSMAVTLTPNEEEALLLEAQWIKKERPRFNVLMKDDKSFPYLMITKNHPAPQLLKVRKNSKAPEGTYFGPFASVKAVNETLDTLTRLFKLRTCSDNVFKNRTRPCLQYHIKRCSAPCVHYIGADEYLKSVQQAQDFLQGKTRRIQKDLITQMETASQKLNYEEAAVYRDRLKALNKVQLHAQEGPLTLANADFFGAYLEGGHLCVEVFFFRHHTSYGQKAFFLAHYADQPLAEALTSFLTQFYHDHEAPCQIYVSHPINQRELLERALSQRHKHPLKITVPTRGRTVKIMKQVVANAKEALELKRLKAMSDHEVRARLQKIVNNSDPLERIEIYDNSHLQGTHPYGIMVVATPEGLEPASYRQFKIRSKSGEQGDDYGMMREVFSRRFKKSNPDRHPQLIILDGGKGQLNSVASILESLTLTIPLIAMAKGPQRDAGKETLYFLDRPPLSLKQHDPLSFYLQRLRDEAHRFAIGTHRAARAKRLTHSMLLDIPGIGAKRKKNLYTYFGSLEKIKEASVETLAKVPGISQSMAKEIANFLTGQR